MSLCQAHDALSWQLLMNAKWNTSAFGSASFTYKILLVNSAGRSWSNGCESGACIGQCSETSPAAAHWYGKDHAHMVKYIQEPCSLYEVTHPKGYPYVMVTMSTHMILTWQLKIHVLKMTLPAEHVKPRRLICRDLDLANVQYGSMHWAGNDMCECPPIRSSCLQSGDGSMPQRVGRMRSQTNNRLLMQGVQVNWKTKLDKVTKF